MSKEEIKTEINKVLDHFSDEALADLLAFLKNIESNSTADIFNPTALNAILKEDNELLQKLAK